MLFDHFARKKKKKKKKKKRRRKKPDVGEKAVWNVTVLSCESRFEKQSSFFDASWKFHNNCEEWRTSILVNGR